MSILSCETFRSNNVDITVTRRDNAVDIDLKDVPYEVASTTSSVVTVNSTVNGNILLGNPHGYQAGQQIYLGGISNAISNHKTLGYRLFIRNGFLKCVKKEIAYSNTITSSYNYVITTASTYRLPNASEDVPKKKRHHAERFYHPAAIWDNISNAECKKLVQKKIVEFALSKGVTVPTKFEDWALDWLAYPLVRELDSPAFSRNIVHPDRNFIAPNFEPMSFKQLVEHYYGSCTSKLLAEVWKVITVGGDFKRTHFSGEDSKKAFFMHGDTRDILDESDQYVTQVGDRRLQPMALTLGPAIFKTMGFDYLYQALPSFALQAKGRMHEAYLEGPRSKAIEFNLTTLLKSVSPKKLLNALLPSESAPDLASLQDTCQMLREYEDHTKIPKKLRLQYPTGLVVDFKFKTLKELHDKISTQYTILKTEASRMEIPIAERYMMLDGMFKDGLKLVVPKDTSVLAVWGKLLNICVASYGDRAERGETLLLGVEKDDAITYCIEFKPVTITRQKLDPLAALVEENDAAPSAIEPEMIKETYPRLEERHCGVTPADTLPEDEIYYMPKVIQFRGQRNCDPSKEDRDVVEVMLVDWVRANLEFFKNFDSIFKEEIFNWTSNAFQGNNLNVDMINNVMRQAYNDVGIRPDQLVMNPQAYQALQNINHQAARHNNNEPVEVRLPDPVFNAGMNVVVDYGMARDHVIIADAQGNEMGRINNIAVD